MEEQDYIELNTLLAKLRVFCLKEIGDPETISKSREEKFRLIRNIDNIRNKMPLIIGDGSIERIK